MPERLAFVRHQADQAPLHPPGGPLDGARRDRLEPLFRRDVSQVRQLDATVRHSQEPPRQYPLSTLSVAETVGLKDPQALDTIEKAAEAAIQQERQASP
ncbi:hypothetical protein LRH25_10610 [Ideonella azotifigens]|uniref:Uncharacterized protein n=1 Tax=Ideonella azotifigens TaxID=513160 RepID=A0ABN1KEL2_9BURK|nr:hypothetical protein [Ideonella azotifigens]MCD2340796.1 hypothetical protein [Ideonella azotifigens]